MVSDYPASFPKLTGDLADRHSFEGLIDGKFLGARVVMIGHELVLGNLPDRGAGSRACFVAAVYEPAAFSLCFRNSPGTARGLGLCSSSADMRSSQQPADGPSLSRWRTRPAARGTPHRRRCGDRTAPLASISSRRPVAGPPPNPLTTFSDHRQREIYADRPAIDDGRGHDSPPVSSPSRRSFDRLRL